MFLDVDGDPEILEMKRKGSVISYPFLFYSLYRFSSTKWGGSRGAPHVWAVSILCVLVSFAFMTVEILLRKNGMSTLSEIELFSFLPESIGAFWPFVFIVIFNFYFFFRSKRWMRYVEKYDCLEEVSKRKGYIFSAFLVSVLFVTHITQILSFS